MKAPLSFASLITLLFVYKSYALNPPVKVELRSSWPAHPVLLECIEAIATENDEAFFPLLDTLTNPEVPIPSPHTPEVVHRSAFEAAISEGFLSRPGEYASVQMDLALHTATPKIEAVYQYYTDRHAARTASVHNDDCGSWVDWYGQVACDVQTLVHLAGVETIDPAVPSTVNASFPRPKLLPFDHVQPSPARVLARPPRTAIFYASLSSSNFRELHSYLYATSSAPNPHIEYVFRAIPPENRDLSLRTYLSGYGVALDLKKMDYLALDDRRQGSSGQTAESDGAVESISDVDSVMVLVQQYPANTDVNASTPLTDDELLNIGLQATQLIYDADEPLPALKQLSQNFPKYAAPLARRITVDPALLDEVEENQVKVPGGANIAWLNGVNIGEKDMNPFALLRLLRKERGTMLSLTSLGLSPEQAIRLLTHPSISAAQSEPDAVSELFDASDRPEEGGVIVWWNDLEKDSRYARWSRSLRILLRPMYPGQFPNVKANLFNVVLAVDLSRSSSLHFISTSVSNIISRSFPARFGIVPIVETEEGARMARLFYYLIENFGRAKTMSFLKSLSQIDIPIQRLTPTVNWGLVRSEFGNLLTESKQPGEGVITNLDTILHGGTESPGFGLDKARAYAARLGVTLTSASQGHAFVNGKHLVLNDDFLRQLQLELGQQLQYLQEQIATGHLRDNDIETISTYFYDLPTTAKRRNTYIHTGKSGMNMINLPDLLSRVKYPSGSFVYPSDLEQIPLSAYIVADFDTDGGRTLMKEALISTKVGSASRVSFIHNPATPWSASTRRPPTSSLLAHLITKDTLHRVSPSRLLKVLGLSEPSVPIHSPQVVISPEGSLDDILGGTLLEDAGQETYEDFVQASRLLVRELGLAAGEQAVIVNGRVVGPLLPGGFVAEDFETLMTYELRKRVEPVVEALENIFGSLESFDRGSYAEMVALTSSVVSAIQVPDPSEVGLFNAPYKPRKLSYQLLSGKYTSFMFGENSTALFHFGIVVDPLSESAQKWSSLIEWLLNIPEVFVELHINPARYRELPLKRFYRYNLQPRLLYDDNGEEIRAETEFSGLAVEPIYTLAMDVPQSWLVRPREALHDLDNIQLSTLSARDRAHGVHAIFELDYLVIEGHARDVLTSAPPRGVQLQLATSQGVPIADTLVVANLGYLQFRTKPGVFKLEIRPGRGREIFKMESVGNEGWDSPHVDVDGDEITLTNFEGLTLYPRLARLPGMDRADVLAEAPPKAPTAKEVLEDIVSWVSSLFSSSKGSENNTLSSPSDQADINIFTVASGLLYERFVSIMVLSVLRNTNSTVKFWFIENFLSPSFLEFIPHLAEAYGFKYELVTYKWPSWLRAQKEKQRIIWAYKILFLDVLFPMDLKKVIFVDADQIVRADLKELVDLDLHGAPYGYTPMGDDNEEMEGFRFWKTGYWKEFLRGLPYHISALYVVDLVRFRQIAAGDILRGHYQQLSADPNSLANLDQDLPNNLQREVPIFSLPEDWLWCETWCSKDRLNRAKTIDLCQNPLTKEPKLARARHIPEWEEYDSEIARFARRLAEEGCIRSEIVAADSNVLADAGAKHRTHGTAVDKQSEGVEGKAEYVRDEL
ncbi:glycosyltransferase family 24 protein [Sparassis latifolia]